MAFFWFWLVGWLAEVLFWVFLFVCFVLFFGFFETREKKKKKKASYTFPLVFFPHFMESLSTVYFFFTVTVRAPISGLPGCPYQSLRGM